MSEEEPTYTVVRMAAGEGKGLPVLIMHITDEDMAEARQQVNAGQLADLAVMRVVVAFLHAINVRPENFSWTPAEYVEILEMLDMPPFEWSPLEDIELTRLLTEAAPRGQ